jgi:hypothetical protein
MFLLEQHLCKHHLIESGITFRTIYSVFMVVKERTKLTHVEQYKL